MKTNRTLFLLSLVLAAVPALSARQAELVPVAVVMYKGENLPVYDLKQVVPRFTATPAYPRDEQIKGIEGQAVIGALVGEDGKVVEGEIAESTPSAVFGEAALKCVLKWRFPKVQKEGKPTRFLVRVPVNFRIG